MGRRADRRRVARQERLSEAEKYLRQAYSTRRGPAAWSAGTELGRLLLRQDEGSAARRIFEDVVVGSQDPQLVEAAEAALDGLDTDSRQPDALYDAFLCNSHADTTELAVALQRGVQTFAKPWFRVRSARVFRDSASLSASPELWAAVEHALDASRYLILVASPSAAHSLWVDREIRYWLETRTPSTILIVLAEGTLAWDASAADFDWSTTTALPTALAGAFDDEPRWDTALERGRQLTRDAAVDQLIREAGDRAQSEPDLAASLAVLAYRNADTTATRSLLLPVHAAPVQRRSSRVTLCLAVGRSFPQDTCRAL